MKTTIKNLAIALIILIFGLYGNAQVELLVNNNFDDGTNDWQIWPDGGSGTTGTFVIDDTGALDGVNSAHITLTAGGGESWTLGFAQGIPAGVSTDNQYKLEYTAKASTNVTLEHQIQEVNSPWGSLYSGTLALTTEAQNFSETFNVSASGACNFVFSLGAIGVGTEVWIDSVHLINLSETAGIDDVYTNIRLAQNYPNPFNSTTTIDFDLLQSDNVGVIVYNSLGKKITHIAEKEFLTGKNSIELDLSNYTNGIYYCTIKSNNYFRTMKMILAK